MQTPQSTGTAKPRRRSGERTKTSPATEWGLRGKQEWAARTWGRGRDVEVGTLGIDVLLMSAWCVCVGERRGEPRKENPFCGPEPFSPGPPRGPFTDTKGLLRKLPTVFGAQRDSWGVLPSPKHPSKSCALFSPREVLVHTLFPTPCAHWGPSVAFIQLRRGQRGEATSPTCEA